jgi:hypothetical protein
MPAKTKRTHEEVIDLTADSSDVEREQPKRKKTRLPVIVNRPRQGTRDTWVQDDDNDDEFDIIDLSQEVDNTGIGFVEVGRISKSSCSVWSGALLTCLR